jgi:hypothetical protein
MRAEVWRIYNLPFVVVEHVYSVEISHFYELSSKGQMDKSLRQGSIRQQAWFYVE